MWILHTCTSVEGSSLCLLSCSTIENGNRNENGPDIQDHVTLNKFDGVSMASIATPIESLLRAQKQFHILPTILIIFFNTVNFGTDSDETKVEINKELDLKECTTYRDQLDVNNSKYVFRACIKHIGETTQRGHYVTIGYNDDDKNFDNGLYLLDDQQVTPYNHKLFPIREAVAVVMYEQKSSVEDRAKKRKSGVQVKALRKREKERTMIETASQELKSKSAV